MINLSTSTDMQQTTLKQINLPKIIGIIIVKTPTLVVRCGGEYLRFKSNARKANRIFQAELERQGLEHATASRLSEVYQSGINTRHLLRPFR